MLGLTELLSNNNCRRAWYIKGANHTAEHFIWITYLIFNSMKQSLIVVLICNWEIRAVYILSGGFQFTVTLKNCELGAITPSQSLLGYMKLGIFLLSPLETEIICAQLCVVRMPHSCIWLTWFQLPCLMSLVLPFLFIFQVPKNHSEVCTPSKSLCYPLWHSLISTASLSHYHPYSKAFPSMLWWHQTHGSLFLCH